MWSIIQPKGRGTNQTPPFPMSSNTLRSKETIPISPWAQRVSRGLWQKEQDVPAQMWTGTLWRSGTADGWKAGYTTKALSTLTGDMRRTDAQQWWDVCQRSTAIGGSGRLLGSLCEPRKEFSFERLQIESETSWEFCSPLWTSWK